MGVTRYSSFMPSRIYMEKCVFLFPSDGHNVTEGINIRDMGDNCDTIVTGEVNMTQS
jgi:hypothetical protein